MNRKFKPPARTDQEHWRMVEYLFKHGFRFESIYVDNVTVPYPTTLDEARAFVRRFGPLRPRRIFVTRTRPKVAPHPKRAVYERLFRPAKRKRPSRA
jgi:hypothetical protein